MDIKYYREMSGAFHLSRLNYNCKKVWLEIYISLMRKKNKIKQFDQTALSHLFILFRPCFAQMIGNFFSLIWQQEQFSFSCECSLDLGHSSCRAD